MRPPAASRCVRLAPLILVLAAGCAELGERAAVRLGPRSLSVQDLRLAWVELEPTARPPLASREDRRAFARRVAHRVLLVEEGRRLAGSEALGEREARTILVRRLQVLLAGSTPVDSSEVATAYERMRARLLVEIRSYPDRASAEAARARLEAGDEPVDSGADTATSRQWVTWSPVPDPVVDAVADLPPGSVTGPVRAGGWWRVLRIEDRVPEDPGPLAQLRPRILAGLRSRREVRVAEELLGGLRENAAVRVDSAAVELLADRTRDAVLAAGAAEQDAGWAVPDLAGGADSLVVAEWNGGRITGSDYARLVQRAGRSQRPRTALRAEVLRLVEAEVASSLLADEARRRGLDRDPWVERAVQRATEDAAVQRAVAGIAAGTEVPASIDSLAILLLETQPGLFRREARARVLRVDSPDLRAVERESQRMRDAGGPAARLAEIVSSRVPPEAGFHVFWLTAGELAAVAAEVFAAGPGGVSGPHRVGDLWVTFGCLDVREAAEPTREDVLAQVRARAAGPDASRVEEWASARAGSEGLEIDDEVLDELAPGG